MRARYYSPVLCRFINADIVAGNISDAVTLNRFAYANGNPVSNVDPFGLSADNRMSFDFGFSAPDSPAAAAGKLIGNWLASMLPGFKEDISNFDLYNTDEQKVLESNYFSAYKGKLVIRLPIGTKAFSFGIMFLGNDLGTGSDAIATVRHEYGHTQQLEKLGIWKYITQVAIPSVTAYRLDLKKDLPYSYFTAPWEADADKYRGVDPSERKNYSVDRRHRLL